VEKNIVEPVRPQLTIWHMRIACCVPKATNTFNLSDTHCFSTATKGTRKRLSVTLYVHCLSCLHCDKITPSSSQQFVCSGRLHLLSNRSAHSLTSNSPHLDALCPHSGRLLCHLLQVRREHQSYDLLGMSLDVLRLHSQHGMF